MDIKEYHETLRQQTDKVYDVAKTARKRGLDAELDIEIPRAEDMAARVESLVGPKGVASRIREMFKEKGRGDIAVEIVKEIVEGKFGDIGDKNKVIEQSIRTGLAVLTEGVVAASIEGIKKTKIATNPDGSEYLAVYFAGPIRSAGGTAEAQAVLIADYARKLLGLENFRPTKTEIERYVEEINLYHNVVARLQYNPSDDELRTIVQNCPICITGEPTAQIEVSVYKNLDRMETNKIRGGMCLVIAEGIAQKAAKILKFSKHHELGWKWLESLIKVEKESVEKEKMEPIEKYLNDIVGGRPIFAYPSRPGGFRLRYGRSRNSGINAKGVHPATMVLLDEFPAIGTQLRIERPGKGTAISPCDSIEGPVIKLKNGDVVRVSSVKKAKDLTNDVEEILFLGDLLISYGDFLGANHPLLPSGITEEWWALLAAEKGIEEIRRKGYEIAEEDALKYAKEFDVPLHPKYTYFYNDISKEDLLRLVLWLSRGDYENMVPLGGGEISRLILEPAEEKRLLEKLCVPHKVREGRIIIENAKHFIETLGLPDSVKKIAGLVAEKETTLDVVNALAPFKIMDKAPVYIGARMGRPEKAKERLMNPPPHGLTPVGRYGGKTRSIVKAAEKGMISVSVPFLICPKCKAEIFGYKCMKCDERAVLVKKCRKCGRIGKDAICGCGGMLVPYHEATVNLEEEIKSALKRLKERKPSEIKGVIGTTNVGKHFEVVEKGILRAKHGISVFKDGTIRFDATNLPLLYFKPAEISVSIEKLKELGYGKDYKGLELKDEEQILELKLQDVLVAENGADYLIRTSKFVDDLLEKFYGLERYYNIETRNDLLGHIAITLAPHTSAGVLVRIIGFTKARVGYCHPFTITARRRDCDGDEDTIMLLLDALLNFSKHYLPAKTGGQMDAPLLLTTEVDPREIDTQAHDMEISMQYPLEFYEATLKNVSPTSVKMPIVKDTLGTPSQYDGIGFTHDTSKIDSGPTTSRYVQLKTMAEKVKMQLALGEKIRAVDEKDVATRVINFHFMRDLYGNLRAFGQQKMRCVECNAKYRRVPLSGKCTHCGGKLLLTVNKGGIEKYLKLSQGIAEKYGLSDYLKQRLKLLENDLQNIFESDKIKQYSLAEFM